MNNELPRSDVRLTNSLVVSGFRVSLQQPKCYLSQFILSRGRPKNLSPKRNSRLGLWTNELSEFSDREFSISFGDDSVGGYLRRSSGGRRGRHKTWGLNSFPSRLPCGSGLFGREGWVAGENHRPEKRGGP